LPQPPEGRQALERRRCSPASFIEFPRINTDGLQGARPSVAERQVDRGRHPSIREKRHSLDQVFIGFHGVRSSWLHTVNSAKRERMIESNGLAD
jgi:hypothetical protein